MSGPAASATLPPAFCAVTRQSRSTPSSAGVGTKLAPVAPGIATSPARHCSASSGAGAPLHSPGSTSTALPITPLPRSDGATREAGGSITGSSTTGAAATVSRKRLSALPPELRAVTTTSIPASSASLEIATWPVAGSTDTPGPMTARVSPWPVKAREAFTYELLNSA